MAKGCAKPCLRRGNSSMRPLNILGYNLLDICVQRAGGAAEFDRRQSAGDFCRQSGGPGELATIEPDGRSQLCCHCGPEPGRIHRPGVRRGDDFCRWACALVQKRGEAMQAAADATPSGMVSVLGLDQGKVEELCAPGARRRAHRRLPICCAPAISSFPAQRRRAMKWSGLRRLWGP